jgi:hypothetical protein
LCGRGQDKEKEECGQQEEAFTRIAKNLVHDDHV